MPVFADGSLPAVSALSTERITVHASTEAPADALRIGVLNLMPLKIPTETDLLRAFSASAEPLLFEFYTTASHVSRNTPAEHISRFYGHLDSATIESLDGLIITGAPVEKIDYENVDYYPEYCRILDDANRSGVPALLLCWAAFAGLYRRYGIDRTILDKKISGVYPHSVDLPGHPLAAGIDGDIYAPQSRFVTIETDRLPSDGSLCLVASSPFSGIHIGATPDMAETFITGHGEYAVETLRNEYERDTLRGLCPALPCNYFEADDPSAPIVNRWQATGRRIFNNWIDSAVCRQKLAKGRRPAAREPQR